MPEKDIFSIPSQEEESTPEDLLAKLTEWLKELARVDKVRRVVSTRVLNEAQKIMKPTDWKE